MVRSIRTITFCLLALVIQLIGSGVGHAQEVRFALVIGNNQYKTGTLATPANDAGLIADTLTAAGFAVTGAQNLDQTTLRETFREFLNQVSSAGPNAVALVYLAGYGLQFEGENYFVPVDADIARDVDVPLQAIRMSDFLQPLAAMPGRVKIVVLDAARQNPFARGGQPLASGLALTDPAPNMAIAFNAAPGTVGPDEQGPYGAYATALTEMIGDGGLSLDDIFARVRLRVSEQTQGAEVPWYASQIADPFFMTERAADAPPPPNTMPLADIRNRPMRDFGNEDDAYAAAIALDTMAGYEQFLSLYPNGAYARRVAAMLAVRREEIAWRRCVTADTPPAYWSYLRRYPNGPHSWDARRRLAMLSVPLEPPPDYPQFDFGVPPPPPDEVGFIDQPVIIFGGPGFGPPPRPRGFFLPPRPREFSDLPPPPPPRDRFALPIAGAVISAFIRPPRTVAVPPTLQGGPPTRPGSRPISLPAAVTRQGPGGPRPGNPPGPPSGAAQNAPAGAVPNVAPNAPSRPEPLRREEQQQRPGQPGVPPAPPPSNAAPNALPHPGQPGGPPRAEPLRRDEQPAHPGQPGAPPAPPNAPIHPGAPPSSPPVNAAPNALPHPGQPTAPPAHPETLRREEQQQHPVAPPPSHAEPPPPPHPAAAPPPPPRPAAPPPPPQRPAAPPPPPRPAAPPPPPPHPAAPPPPPPHPAAPPPPPPHPAAPPPPPPPPHPAPGCPPGKTATPSGCK
ncbi:MAG TPA: caspase domain-containing protein [Xanthobacteraceae bacterium]|nr:caspase domain-containing protein [Xanthobacteraceae bacterium]